MTRSVRFAAILVTIFVVAVACGGDDQARTVPEPTRVETTTLTTNVTSTAPSAQPTNDLTSTSGSSSTTSTTVESVEATTTATAAPAAIDVMSLLPTLEDMPAGWSPDDSDDEATGSEEDVDAPDCLDQLFDSVGLGDDLGEMPNSASVAFTQSNWGPFASAAVVVQPNIDLSSVFDEIGPQAAACDGTTDSEGNTVAVLPLSFPQVGDETFAARMDYTGSFPVSIQLVLAAKNGSLAFAAYVAVGGAPDVTVVELMIRHVIDRL